MARFQERRSQRFSAAGTESEPADIVASLELSAEAAEDSSPPPQGEDSAAIELFEMADAPKTGETVNLQRPDGALVEARWREPRRYHSIKMRWVVEPGWFYSGQGAPRIDFEPVAWARAWT